MKPKRNFADGVRDETLLEQGRYKEWFWKGLNPEALKFMRTEVGGRTRPMYLKCSTCGVRQPRASFNIGQVGDEHNRLQHRCNRCSINSSRASERWENDLPVGWEKQASCEGADPELFFPEDTTAYLKPDAPWRSFCPECPVKELCEQYARISRSSGVFGGKLHMWKSNTLTVVDETTAKPAGRPKKVA